MEEPPSGSKSLRQIPVQNFDICSFLSKIYVEITNNLHSLSKWRESWCDTFLRNFFVKRDSKGFLKQVSSFLSILETLHFKMETTYSSFPSQISCKLFAFLGVQYFFTIASHPRLTCKLRISWYSLYVHL